MYDYIEKISGYGWQSSSTFANIACSDTVTTVWCWYIKSGLYKF